MKLQLNEWINNCVIEPADSPWASPLVPVKKKNGQIRWACDFRVLNSLTIEDSFPTPNISEVLETLGESKVFSTLDAQNAYHCISIEKKSRPLTAFTTAFGLYQFVRLPFGLKNAGASYCRLVSKLIEMLGVEGLLAYLDDILLHTQDASSHLKLLRLVLQAHRESGIKLNPEKTCLLQSKVEYLGYEVSQEGIKLIPSYVDKVLNWPTPETGKELAAFLGFTNYYREFMPDFAKMTADLNTEKSKKVIVWTENLLNCFNKVKTMFTQAPCRAAPDFGVDSKPFILTIDFSKQAVAAILSQEQHGTERFLGVKGRKCRIYESNYHSSKGELLAIMYGLQKFNHLLRWKKFVVITDSNTVLHWSTMKDPGGTIRRWLDFIQEFNFTVHHRAGKDNVNADLISRAKHMSEPTPSDEGTITQNAADVYTLPWISGDVHQTREKYIPLSCSGKVCSVVELPWNLAGYDGMECSGPPMIASNKGQIGIDAENLYRAQNEDGVLTMVKSWINNHTGEVEDKNINMQDMEELHSEVKQLYAVRKQVKLMETSDQGKVRLLCLIEGKYTNSPVYRLIMPPTHRYQAMLMVHGPNHWGVQRTTEEIKQRFYWPGWRTEVSRFVSECAGCLHREVINLKDNIPTDNRALRVNQTICMDLVGPLPLSKNRNKYILTIFDQFSRFVVTVPIPDKSAATVCSHIYNRWIALFGTPDSIRTDAGSEFNNNLLANMMLKMGVRVKIMFPYNHQSNPVERFHRTLWCLLRSKLANGEQDWEKSIPAVELAYNSSINASTGCSPARGFLGRELQIPHLSILPKFENPELNNETCGLEEDMDKVWEEMRMADDVRIRRQFRAYTGKQENLEIGDYVYAAVLPSTTNSRKLAIKWSGPLIIEQFVNETMIRIREIRVKKPRSYVAHRTKLRLARRNGSKDVNPSFILPRMSLKEAIQIEDALSTVTLPAKIFNDRVEDEFHPQVGMSLSGGSSTTRAGSDKSASQKSKHQEQDQLETNPQQEEEEKSLNKDQIQTSQGEQREENRTPEELFNEHFTAEPVRDEILEEMMSEQVVITTPASHPQEDWQQLRIEDSMTSAASTASSSTNSSGRRSGRIRKQTQGFDMSVKMTKSKSGAKAVLKNVVQTAKREWKKRPSGAPTVTASREREGAGSFKTPTLIRKRSIGAGSLKTRRSRDESEQRKEDEAERIWQEATTEEDDNRSILTRAASLEDLQNWETGSIVGEGVEVRSVAGTGSVVNESRKGGTLNLVKKSVMCVSETCDFKPQEGKWVYVDYNPQLCKAGEYLQPMLLNTIVERNLRDSKFSPRAGDKRSPAIYIVNLNNSIVQLRRGESLGTLIRLRAEDGQGGEGMSTKDGYCRSCSSSCAVSNK